MSKFRKKPVVIEAMRFPGLPGFGFERDEIEAMERFDAWLSANQGERCCRYVGNTVVIPTLEGEMRADPGDWIIRGVKGELYPCKPDIFAATYEPA
jgi:hypothetical protein